MESKKCPKCGSLNVADKGFYGECKDCGFRGIMYKFLNNDIPEDKDSITIELDDTYTFSNNKSQDHPLGSLMLECWRTVAKIANVLLEINSLLGNKLAAEINVLVDSFGFYPVRLAKVNHELQRYMNFEKLISLAVGDRSSFADLLEHIAKEAGIEVGSVVTFPSPEKEGEEQRINKQAISLYLEYLLKVEELAEKVLNSLKEMRMVR